MQNEKHTVCDAAIVFPVWFSKIELRLQQGALVKKNLDLDAQSIDRLTAKMLSKIIQNTERRKKTSFLKYVLIHLAQCIASSDL